MSSLIHRGCGLGKDVADLRLEVGVQISATEAELVPVVLHILNS